jgi:DNA-binding phage protein
MRILELDDVISLLRSEVERAGNQEAWAQKAGVHRVYVNKVLNGHRPPNQAIINALSLRMVFVPKSKSTRSK